MSRPDSPHVTALRAFRENLVEARRAAAQQSNFDANNLDAAVRRFIDLQTAITLVDKAIENEMDLTPLPRVDDPTELPPKI
ncbi:MAG: hypothetical protein ABI398_15360 [Devosia sp.]